MDTCSPTAPQWPATVAVGKTLVSSSMIDRVAARLHRRLIEVPVGFKWFVDGLIDGTIGFGGEESAGSDVFAARRHRLDDRKDGLVPNLLAAEITARTGKDPGEHYRALTAEFGTPYYTRIDAPATPEQKARLEKLSPDAVAASKLAGEPITAKLTKAPGNNAPIGGLKVVAARLAGSRHGLRARKTSTKSTRRALRTRLTWTRLCVKPSGSSITRWRLLSLTVSNGGSIMSDDLMLLFP